MFSDLVSRPVIETDSGRFDLSPGATREDVKIWLRDRLDGEDPAYGFGRGGEDEGTPHLLVDAFYRRGMVLLRQFLEGAAGDLLIDALRSPTAVSDRVLEGLLRWLTSCPLVPLTRSVLALVEEGALEGRPMARELQDRALTVLSVLDVPDLDLWSRLAARDPRPVVVQAGLRALARVDVEAGLVFVEGVVLDAAVDPHVGPAVATLLPSLYETWRMQRPEASPWEFVRRLERLPAVLAPAIRPTLELLRRRLSPSTRSDLTSRMLARGLGIGLNVPSETWQH